MRVILTNNEAAGILATLERFEGASIEIEVPNVLNGVNREAIDDFVRGVIPPNEKIAYIKKLRELIPGLGLATAKYMVEAFMLAKPR